MSQINLFSVSKKSSWAENRELKMSEGNVIIYRDTNDNSPIVNTKAVIKILLF